MKRFKSLIIIDKFRWLFEKMNIDYDVMRKILEIKITMDERRVTTIYRDKEDDEKKHKNKFKQSLTMYIIMSVFLSLLIFFKMNTLFKMNFFFGLVIFLIMTTMISDFSSVLLDIREKSILSIRPISNNTLNMAKIRSEEHTSELQSRQYLVCRLLLEKKQDPLHISCSPVKHD